MQDNEQKSTEMGTGIKSGNVAATLFDKEHYALSLALSPNKTERVVLALVDYIRTMGLKPGDKLPSQETLCEMLRISGRSLREAMIYLKGMGLLKPNQGTGWYVQQFEPARSLRFLAPAIQSVVDANLCDIIQVRLAHEPIIARAASENRTEEGLAQLAQTLEKMKEAGNSHEDEKFVLHDREFHNILAQECGNSIFAMLNSLLVGLFFSYQRKLFHGDYVSIVQAHQKIFDAVKAQDADAAQQAMEEHMKESQDFVIRNY